MFRLEDIPIVILAGGKGTRLKNIFPSTPKPLVEINSRPFLYWQLVFFLNQGFRKFYLSTGYLHNKINDFIQLFLKSHIKNIEYINCIPEAQPLGTFGGLLNVINDSGYKNQEEILIVANGDSFITDNIYSKIQANKIDLDTIYILSKHVENADRYGLLEVDGDGRVLKFLEKKNNSSGYINLGIYIIPVQILKNYKSIKNLSFEFDFFPQMMKKYQIKIIKCDGDFIDIGTEDSYKQSGSFISNNKSWF